MIEYDNKCTDCKFKKQMEQEITNVLRAELKDNKWLEDEILKFQEYMAREQEQIIQKMPKDHVQKTNWLLNRQNDLEEELVNSGIDMYSLLGMLECLRAKLLMRLVK